MLILMMMMVANRNKQQQQQQACHQHRFSGSSGSQLCEAIGKSSNSSNETVIARIDSPEESAPNGCSQARHQSNSKATQTDSNSEETTIVQTTTTSDAPEQPTMPHHHDQSVGSANSDACGSASRGAAGSSSSRLKSFLLLTTHQLNPFYQQHDQPPRKKKKKKQTGRKSSLDHDDIDSTAATKAVAETASKQPTRSYLSLFGFRLKRQPANHKQLLADSTTKSCPVTPIKWQPLEGGVEPAPPPTANGYCGSSSNNNDRKRDHSNPSTCSDLPASDDTLHHLQRQSESPKSPTTSQSKQANSTASSGGSQSPMRPSVRFVESLEDKANYSSRQTTVSVRALQVAGCQRRQFADRAVQTTATNNETTTSSGGEATTLNEQQPSDEHAEVNIVAKLFKLCPQSAGNDHEQQKGECPMDSERFRQYGYSLIDYISNYLDTIDKRRVTPLNIEPGYLKSLIQPDAPEKGEPFANIMHDFENHIMCGITHWQHPHFHAYFPAGNAYPSILADMLSDALGCVGFSWAASPAYTELEIIMLDWMGKMIGLPDEFLCLSGSRSSAPATKGLSSESSASTSSSSSSSGGSKGGGVIQGSASECVLVSVLAARHWAIDRLRKKYPNTPDGILLTKLIGYCSKEAHSCVEKAAMIGFIRMRALDTDDKHSLRGETLAKAMAQDRAQGLEPFIVCATLGTTSCVSFDNLEELGQVCKQEADDEVWLHVDAAYAGSALICPEFKYLMRGIELATSFNMNPNKWMLINFDCSLMWVKDRFKLTRAFVVDPLYLQHSFSDQAIDYRHWGIPLSRRFRALKLWFVIRNYGIEGLQSYIRNHVRLAKLFAELIRQDSRFLITNEVVLGLVCFRLVGSNALNQRLLSMINASGKLHMVPASLNGRYVIRFCVCDQNAQEKDIRYAYSCISEFATELFESIRAGKERIRAISQQNTIDVSSISLHTQQSASADRLNGGADSSTSSTAGELQPGDQQQQVAAAQQPGSPMTAREAARQYMLTRRNSRHTERTDSGERVHSPLAKSPLIKQASTLVQQTSGSAAPIQQSAGNSQLAPNDLAADNDDLEQEIVLDSLATIDGYDYLDLEDDEDLDLDDDEDLEAIQLPAGRPTAADSAAQPTEQQTAAVINRDRWPFARARHGWHPARAQTAATNGGEQEEAQDEVSSTLAERRNRMSLRYKREFFVRVVSDPRVYRASISGDINAHASCASLGGQQQQPQPPQQQQQQQQGATSATTNSMTSQ